MQRWLECKMMQLPWENRKMVVPKKLKIESPHDPAIPLLDVYAKELKGGSQRDIFTLMFTAALFTTARKQPRCPATDDG